MQSWPAPVAHPPVVGGYVVSGVRDEHEAGALLDAVDDADQPVVLVRLAAGAAADGAAVDRFDQAVTGLNSRHPELVVDLAGLTERPPWVGLSADPAGRRAAAGLLTAVVPAGADEAPRAGPGFRLPWYSWRRWAAGRAPWAGTKVPPGWRRLWWLIGVLALMAILGLLLSMCQAPPPDPSQPSPGRSGPSSPAEQNPQPASPTPGQEQPSEGSGGSENSRKA